MGADMPAIGTKVRSIGVLGAWDADRPTAGTFAHDVPHGSVGDVIAEWPTEPDVPWVLVRFVLIDGTPVDAPLVVGDHAEVVS